MSTWHREFDSLACVNKTVVKEQVQLPGNPDRCSVYLFKNNQYRFETNTSVFINWVAFLMNFDFYSLPCESQVAANRTKRLLDFSLKSV